MNLRNSLVMCAFFQRTNVFDINSFQLRFVACLHPCWITQLLDPTQYGMAIITADVGLIDALAQNEDIEEGKHI